MNWRKLAGLPVCGAVMALATLAWANLPDLSLSFAVSNATEQVLVYSVPDGTGRGFDEAYAAGGILTDATVTLTLLHYGGAPFVDFPFEDLWIETSLGDFVWCGPGGTVADQNTDTNGQTTWTNPMYAGGHGTGLVVMVIGEPLEHPPLDYLFNSADINADLIVNLTDVVIFASVYWVGYDWIMDFNNDGTLNLTDIVFLAMALGTECP